MSKPFPVTIEVVNGPDTSRVYDLRDQDRTGTADFVLVVEGQRITVNIRNVHAWSWEGQPADNTVNWTITGIITTKSEQLASVGLTFESKLIILYHSDVRAGQAW